MTRPGLTRKQSRALEFITIYTRQHRCSPTLREIGGWLGDKSVSQTHGLIERLIGRGYLVKRADRSRSLAIVPDSAQERPGFILPPDLDALIRDGAKASGISANEMLTRIIIRWRNEFTPCSVSRETPVASLEVRQ